MNIKIQDDLDMDELARYQQQKLNVFIVAS